MDELSAQLNTTGLNPENNDDSEFVSLYKNWGRFSNQEQRRKDILEIQKGNRNSSLDTCRGILEIVNEVEDREWRRSQQSYRTRYRPSIYVAGFTKTSRSYRDVLMMSEWMVEKPEDFNENWYAVPCPKGVRTLVVASHGITKLYSKYGSFRQSCRTALPGGNPCDSNSKSRCVVLDCFHCEATNTLFVLDLLAWNSQPMTDGETEFRHFWMKTHIEEISALKTINYKNKILFQILPKVECSQDSFNSFMMTLPHFNNGVPHLDGILFYHKLSHYFPGQTPLVGWLFPFMVHEVLGSDVTVNLGYIKGQPKNYTNQAQYIQEFEEKLQKKLPRFARTSISMDTSIENRETTNNRNMQQEEHPESARSNNDAEMTADADSKEADSTEADTKLNNNKTAITEFKTNNDTDMKADVESPETGQPSTDIITESTME